MSECTFLRRNFPEWFQEEKKKMNHKVFACYDKKIENYLTPFTVRTRGEALRSWEDLVNDPKTQFNRHPDDFVLMELGDYDLDSGKFTNLPNGPLDIGPARQFIKQTQN